MDLLRCDGSGAVLHVTPAECVSLAKLCRRAGEGMIGIEEEAAAEAARTYAALFTACALGVMAPGFLDEGTHAELRADLVDLGIGELLQPWPGGGGGTR